MIVIIIAYKSLEPKIFRSLWLPSCFYPPGFDTARVEL